MMTEEEASFALAKALHDMAKAVGATGELVYSARLYVTEEKIEVTRPTLEQGRPKSNMVVIGSWPPRKPGNLDRWSSVLPAPEER